MAEEGSNTSNTSRKDNKRRQDGGRGGKRNVSDGRPSSAASNGPGSRPQSRNLKSKGGSPEPNPIESQKSEAEPRSSSQRSKTHGGARGGHKKAQSAAQATSKGQTNPRNNATPVESVQDGSEALQRLQHVITDLKSISPPVTNAPLSGNTLISSASANNMSSLSSNLPPHAPVFQPGASAYSTASMASISPVHRKAASMGSSPTTLPANYTSPLHHFQSNLGSMEEDAEDHGASFEEGEIQESNSWQSAVPPRSVQQTSSGFTAPRFAALAQQQQQQQHEAMGTGGRPQLAPGFTFGGPRRPSAAAVSMEPAIGEEDVDFKFPQQQSSRIPMVEDSSPEYTNRRLDGHPEVTGLMAEQIAIQNQIEALQQEQQRLYQEQLASSQVMASLSTTPGSRVNSHRRVQSTAPTMMGQANFGLGPGFVPSQPTMPNFNNQMNNSPFGEEGSISRGHGRRHSVNVFNNKSNPSSFGITPSVTQDGFDDGFLPPSLGGHSRNPSRVDSTWRINGGAGAIQNSGGLSSELAQAQAQLSSLQQFRAAAGGHHQKMASFSFPNMLPNMMTANLMGLAGMNVNPFQQQQQFQMQLQQQTNQPQRKSLFAPYLPQASLPPLLAAGKLVVGILRVNKRNRSDAYVATEVLDADIYICGSKDRNRALEGDIVAVELLDVDEVWGTKKEKEEKKRKKEENAVYDSKATGGRKNDKKKDDVEVEGQGLMLFEDEEVTDEVKPQYAGHVVAVVERMPGQLFSGTLGLLRPSSAATKEKQEAERREREGDRAVEEKKGPIERPKIVWFRPTDKRVPLIAIPTEQAPPDFVQNSDSYTDKLFVACIKRHPISSLHPFGTLVEELGPIGNIEVETSALLKDCNFPTEEFNDNVLKCVPPVPWSIPVHELENRRDFRGSRSFTIDPADAKDLDDALSVDKNGDGSIDVAVHIADVSYFVKPNTALDRDARKRGTSVYLIQRSVPMLPPALSEQLCSLVPGLERLAFTVMFTFTEDARVVRKWMGKTVIKSVAKLSYEDAQGVLEGRNIRNIESSVEDRAAMEADISTLQALATHLRRRREENGILNSHSERLSFTLDSAGLPTDCQPYIRTEAHSLIEEFMLLANQAVAQQLAIALPEQALLRRHEEPIDRRLAALVDKAYRLGVTIDASTAGSLSKSLEAVDNNEARKVLTLASHKAIHRAKYFCAGMLDIAKYNHYALNIPVYTHFTSPIRRYTDLIVHRQLESVLSQAGQESKFNMDRDSVAKVAQQCNIKRDSAKLAQEQSTHLYMCHFIADLTQRYGPVVRQATVVGVLDAAFDVFVPEFGIEKRVHVDQMPIENHVYNEHDHTLSIYWSTRDVITWLAENSDDEHLKKVKQNAELHAAKMEVTSRSVHDESALFDEDEDDIVLAKEQTEETSKQRLLSKARVAPSFVNLRQGDGHRIQDVKELMSVPVIVTADLSKSPAVIKVYSVNPYTLRS